MTSSAGTCLPGLDQTGTFGQILNVLAYIQLVAKTFFRFAFWPCPHWLTNTSNYLGSYELEKWMGTHP